MPDCCGQSKTDTVVTNRQPLLNGGLITNQPTFHPQPNNVFQQPSLSPPPVAHPNTFSPNGFQQQNGFQHQSGFQQQVGFQQQNSFQQQQPAWGQSHSPPPMNEYGATPISQATTLPTFTGTTYNGSQFDAASGFSPMNQPITLPKSLQSPHSPPPQLNAPVPRSNAPPIQDEGKMSISIDFGMCQHITLPQTLIFVQAQHFLVL